MAEELFAEEETDFYDAGEDAPVVEDKTEATVTPEQLANWKSQAETMQRFANDPDFARQVVLARAAQLGIQVGTPSQAAPAKPSAPPAEYLQTVADSLDPQMKFLAPQIAAATWAATQSALEPVRAQQQQAAQTLHNNTYNAWAQELEAEAPGWKQYEGQMEEALNYLKAIASGNTAPHPKYGSPLKVLYRLASGDAAATANAGRRMQEAQRNATRTSQGGTRGEGPSLEKMLESAKTPQQKWATAFRHALRENGAA